MPSPRVQKFLRQNWMLLSVLLGAAIIAAWFIIHALLQFVWFHDPEHVDVELRGWMTPRYIVKTYDLPRPLVLETLQLDPESHRPKTLKDIAADLGMTLPELTALIRETAETYRQGNK